MKVCSVEGCGRVHEGRGFCTKHYQRFMTHSKKNNIVLKKCVRIKIQKICKVDGCDKISYVRGYCTKHYHKILRYGSLTHRTIYTPNDIILYEDRAEIILRNVKQKEVGRAIIDLDDVDRVRKYKWSLSSDGYADNSNRFRLHRFIMNAEKFGQGIDHINRNTLDDRKVNLRFANQSLNGFNQKIPKHNTSGVVGVIWDKFRNKWRSEIMYKDKHYYLGRYDNFDDAVTARKKGELKYYGEVIVR